MVLRLLHCRRIRPKEELLGKGTFLVRSCTVTVLGSMVSTGIFYSSGFSAAPSVCTCISVLSTVTAVVAWLVCLAILTVMVVSVQSILQMTKYSQATRLMFGAMNAVRTRYMSGSLQTPLTVTILQTFDKRFVTLSGVPNMANGKFIAYFRVSTEKQGRSGLGLDAQKAAVVQFLNNGSWQLVGSYHEVESGKKADRPELAKALKACKLQGATLIVAKLDRLSRSVSFISALIESNVEFRACDMPEANKLVLHIMASMAQHEREMISARTKVALQVAKARGQRLGNSNLRAPEGVHALGTAAIKEKANRSAADRLPIIESIQAEGIITARGIAAELTRRGIQTSRGSTAWQATQVQRILSRVSC